MNYYQYAKDLVREEQSRMEEDRDKSAVELILENNPRGQELYRSLQNHGRADMFLDVYIKLDEMEYNECFPTKPEYREDNE